MSANEDNQTKRQIVSDWLIAPKPTTDARNKALHELITQPKKTKNQHLTLGTSQVRRINKLVVEADKSACLIVLDRDGTTSDTKSTTDRHMVTQETTANTP